MLHLILMVLFLSCPSPSPTPSPNSNAYAYSNIDIIIANNTDNDADCPLPLPLQLTLKCHCPSCYVTFCKLLKAPPLCLPVPSEFGSIPTPSTLVLPSTLHPTLSHPTPTATAYQRTILTILSTTDVHKITWMYYNNQPNYCTICHHHQCMQQCQ